MIVSEKPRPLVSYHLLYFSFPIPFLFTAESFTLSSADVTNFVLSSMFSVTHQLFPTSPVRKQFIPDHGSSFHSRRLRGLPPFRTSPSENMFQGLDQRIMSIFTNPFPWLHTLSAITSYREGKPIHLYPHFPGRSASARVIVGPCFIFLSSSP